MRLEGARAELVSVAAGALLLATVGAWFGGGWWLVAAGFAGYAAWTGFQLYRLFNWLAHPKRNSLPVRIGLWREVADHVVTLRERGRNRKKRLRNILGGFQESTSALPDATVVLDEDWRIEWSNNVARDILGIGKLRDHAARIFDFVGDPLFREYIEEGDFSRPLQMPAPVDYGVVLEVRVVPYGKGKHLIQARDITRLNQLETIRRDFVANVSHELRTPLTVIHGYLETLVEADDDDELDQWKPVLGQMHHQSLRLQRIVEDLLTLSRLETRDRAEGAETIVVEPMLRRITNVAKSLSAAAAHDIAVSCDEAVNLYANPAEIESAFSNLVFNAVRYTPPGGRIRLRWWLDHDAPCFAVIDNGVGIDARHIPRLTERFYRVDVGRSRANGGTGLGLAIVKHILIRHGARLEIESQPGEGSTFTCRFPATRARPGRVAASGS